MRHRLRKNVFLLTALVSVGLIFYACRKNSGSGLSARDNVTELQAWLHTYGQSYTNGEMIVVNSNGEVATNKLNWGLANFFKSKKNSYYEIPFVDEKDPNKQTGFSMVFQKNVDEIVARVKYSYDNANPGTGESGYSKVAIFDNLNGKNDASWAWYNGLNFPTKIYKKKATSTTGSRIKATSQKEIKTNVADDCRPLLVPVYNYECRSTYVDEPSHLTCGYYKVGYDLYTLCFESSEWGTPTGGGEGGSGAGGGGGSEGGEFNYDDYLEVNNRLIVDSLAGYPCAQNLLATMFNINDSMAAIIKSLFGDTNKININFSIGQHLAGTNTMAETRPSGGPTSFDAIVKLNPDMLTKATQDYIAATLIHEALHAYIGYYKVLVNEHVMSQNDFANKFPIYAAYRFDSLSSSQLSQHSEIAQNYVDVMTTFLKNLNFRIPDSVANALAWGGLYETTAWKARSDTNRIKYINAVALDATIPENKTWRLSKCK